MDNKKNVFFAIEMSDIVFWIMKWKWIVISITIVFAILGYVFNNLTYVPMYTTQASMVVNSQTANRNQQGNQVLLNDVYLTQTLMDTYTNILTSDKIAKYIIDELDIGYETSDIKNSIKIIPEEGTQVVKIEVTAKDPYMAKNIANTMMQVAPALMMEVVETGSVNVLDYAVLPIHPNSPATIQYIVIAALLGAVLSSVVIIIINFLTMKVKNSEDIEYKTGLTVFGEIPHASYRSEVERTLLYTNKTNSGFTESYFMMGAALKNHLADKKPYKLLITSSVAGEGKSTTSINTATVLADMGHKVLLIDLDLKKPHVTKHLEIDVTDLEGVEAVFKGDRIEEHIIDSHYGFDIIPCVKSVKSTSKLLSSIRLQSFFAELDATDYDFIILDTAPAHIIADTSVIVKFADGVLMVVKQHFARLKTIMTTISNLKKSGANIIGSVLNDVRVYNVGTGYAYKYRYGYYSKNKKNNEYGYYYGYGELEEEIMREVEDEEKQAQVKLSEADSKTDLNEKKTGLLNWLKDKK